MSILLKINLIIIIIYNIIINTINYIVLYDDTILLVFYMIDMINNTLLC